MSFGSGGQTTPRLLVERAQKVAAPPHRGVAREAVTLLVGGVPQVLEVVRQPRINGAQQGYWLCPRCSALRSDLFVVDGTLLCRVCHRLDYLSRHVPRAVVRAAKLRRALNAPPGLLSPLLPRPPHWRRDYWARTVTELAAAERVIAEMLRGTVTALKRRKGRLHGPR